MGPSWSSLVTKKRPLSPGTEAPGALSAWKFLLPTGSEGKKAGQKTARKNSAQAPERAKSPSDGKELVNSSIGGGGVVIGVMVGGTRVWGQPSDPGVSENSGLKKRKEGGRVGAAGREAGKRVQKPD